MSASKFKSLLKRNDGVIRIYALLYPQDSTVTPPLTHCVEKFHRYHSNEKNIIARLFKLASHEKCLNLPYYWS